MFFATDLRMGVGTVAEVVPKTSQEIIGHAVQAAGGYRGWHRASECNLTAIRSRRVEASEPSAERPLRRDLHIDPEYWGYLVLVLRVAILGKQNF